MGAKEFGGLVERRMAELGISQNRLASRLGELPDGRIFDATQVRLLRLGRRRLDHELVQRLIDLLAMDEVEAWSTSGLWPPDLDADGYRQYRQQLAAVGAVSDQPDPRSGPFQGFPARRRRSDRRQRDRRHLRLAPAA